MFSFFRFYYLNWNSTVLFFEQSQKKISYIVPSLLLASLLNLYIFFGDEQLKKRKKI